MGQVEDVDSVASVKGSNYNWAALTIGGIYDIDRITLDKQSGVAIVPYVGLGVGYDGGYMNGQKNTESNCGYGRDSTFTFAGCASGDDRSDHGFAMRGTV